MATGASTPSFDHVEDAIDRWIDRAKLAA